MTRHDTVEALIEEMKETSRCPGCDGRLSDIFSFPARSRYGHGDLCSDCGGREAFEGDYIRQNILRRLGLDKASGS